MAKPKASKGQVESTKSKSDRRRSLSKSDRRRGLKTGVKQRPVRSSAPSSFLEVDKQATVGLSWEEESQLNRALHASLQVHRRQSPSTSKLKKGSPTEACLLTPKKEPISPSTSPSQPVAPSAQDDQPIISLPDPSSLKSDREEGPMLYGEGLSSRRPGNQLSSTSFGTPKTRGQRSNGIQRSGEAAVSLQTLLERESDLIFTESLIDSFIFGKQV